MMVTGMVMVMPKNYGDTVMMMMMMMMKVMMKVMLRLL